MRIFSTLHVIFLILIQDILPLMLVLFAIIKVSKAQSISKKNKIILSIAMLFFLFIIKIWHNQSNFENAFMLRAIFICLIYIVIYIGQIVLFLFVIEWIRKTETISKTVKIILIVIISVCLCIMISDYSDEIIDEKYITRNEMVDNNSLIGLSEEEVIALLGEPASKNTYQLYGKNYTYYDYGAGTIREEWFWGKYYSTKYYELNIMFDENGIVKDAYVKECP